MLSRYLKLSCAICTLAAVKTFALDAPCCESSICEPATCEEAADCCQPEDCSGWNFYTDWTLSTGYRQDRLTWTIADPTGSPNILSELQWNDLRIWEIKGQFEVLFCDRIYVRGYADYGKIFHGRNRDSDYAGNDKTLEFSRSKAKSDKGEVFDFSGGIGYQFHLGDWFCLCDTDWTFTPLLGYSYHEQHLRDYDGVQLINSAFNEFGEEVPAGPLGPFPGLHSNYRAKWRGPWVGFDTCYPISCDWKVFGSFEYHWAHYHGTGHWNLRPDFIKDFTQTSNNGHGYVIDAGTSYDFWCNWSAGLTFSYQWMRSGSGRDRTFFISGPADTRFNGATWHNWSILADLGYAY